MSDTELYINAVIQLAEEFKTNPMDFILERDLQARLYEILRESLEERGRSMAQFACSNRLMIGDKTPDYKQGFGDLIEAKLRDQNQVSRVHTEVAFHQPLEAREGREQFDIAVLREQIDRPFAWNDGSKRADMDLVAAAIELKYIKNKKGFPVNLKFDDIEDADISSIAARLKKDANDIEEDLDELEEVNDVYTTDVFILIASNYDYLHRSEKHDTSVRRNHINRKVGKAVVYWIQQNYSVPVLYTSPFTTEWVNRPSADIS